MAKYDVTDEAIINASPAVVYQAIIDEMDGKTSWWMPHRSSKLREGDSYSNVGSLLDTTVNVHGKLPIKFTTKTVEVKKNEVIRVNYVEGTFNGEGFWKFDHFKDKTKLSYRWRTSPSALFMRIFAPFLPVAKSHSDSIKIGFKNLNEFLKEKSES